MQRLASGSARVWRHRAVLRALGAAVPFQGNGALAAAISRSPAAGAGGLVRPQGHVRWCAGAAAAGPEWAEHEFRAVAEGTLEVLADALSEAAEASEDDCDVEFSQGVLTASLGPGRVYVLNTQTPNRQIWLSSPTSGPWRYAWHAQDREWRATRDDHRLLERLADELADILPPGAPIDFAPVRAFIDNLPE